MLAVKQICKDQGISISALARDIGLKPEALLRAISEKGNPTLSTLKKISDGLGVEIHKLFEEYYVENEVNGYLEIRGEIKKISSLDDLVSFID